MPETQNNWKDAKGYCRALVHEGQSGWRLPEKTELESLVRKRELPAIDRVALRQAGIDTWFLERHRGCGRDRLVRQLRRRPQPQHRPPFPYQSSAMCAVGLFRRGAFRNLDLFSVRVRRQGSSPALDSRPYNGQVLRVLHPPKNGRPMPHFCNACGHSNPTGSAFCGKCGQPMAPPDIDEPEPLDLTGQVLNGRYHVDAKLGQGGMGAVFRATDSRLTREVALKVLSPELVAHPTARRRMTQEANALARIEHPNVVRLFDVFDEGQMFVMVLELISGGDLRQRIQSQGMPEVEALRLMDGILQGLQAIHEAGLVHRDVKPENVLMTQKDLPKLADLGVARDASGAGKTRLGARLGTPEYMSPEQAQGLTVDHRSDLFSAGLVFFELLAGVRPFAGTSELDVMSAVVHQPPNLARLHGKIEQKTGNVIEALLQKDPERRVQSASDARAMLGTAVVVGGASAKTQKQQVARAAAPKSPPTQPAAPAPVLPEVATAAPATTSAATGKQSKASQRPSTPRWRVGGGALAMVVVVKLLYFWSIEHPRDVQAGVLALAPSAPTESVNLVRAKAEADRVVALFNTFAADAEAAGGDQQRLTQLNDQFQRDADTMKVESDELEKALTDDERASLHTYFDAKMAPGVAKLDELKKKYAQP